MDNAQALVFGNVALVPHALEAAAVPLRPRFAVVEGARAVRAVAPEQQLWAPDAFAARTAKRSDSDSLARCIVTGALLTVLVVAAAFAFVSARLQAEHAAVAASSRIEVSVTPGDSLWSLASDHPVEGLDTAQTVEVIRDWNGLAGSALSVGSVLTVPAAS